MECLKSCRLCLSPVSDKNYEEFESVSNDVYILLKLDLDDGQKHVMCNICSKRLRAALEFKSTCITTEAAIIPYVDSEKPVPLDLREIYMKEKGVSILDGQKICRLCMQLVKDEFTSVYELEINLLQKYVSEMNFSDIKNPIICKPCWDTFVNYRSFIKNFFDVEERIKNSFNENIDNKQLLVPHSVSWIKTEGNEQDDNEGVAVKTEERETEFEATEKKWEEVSIKMEDIEVKSECMEEQSLPSTHSPLELHEIPVATKQEVIDDVENYLDANSESCSCDDKTLNKQKVETNLNNYKNCSDPNLYKCNFCNNKSKPFSDSIIKLNGKVLTHKESPEIQSYECDICGYKLKHKRYLKKHMVMHKHSSEIQWLMCDVCDYKSKRKFHLKQHMMTHKDSSEIQWHECDICDFKSKWKLRLKSHMLVHTDSSELQWYDCDICNYKSKYKSYLKRHMLTHKDSSEIEWHECDRCSFKSKWKSRLKSHMLRHTDSSEIQWHECKICNFKSKHQSSLKSHMLTHKDSSEIKWYECEKCGYKSKYKSHLKTHMLSHKDSSTHCQADQRLNS